MIDNFEEQNKAQLKLQEKFLLPFYFHNAKAFRTIGFDTDEEKQLQYSGVDVVLKVLDRQITADEKIVNWPDRDRAYDAFVIETWSNSIPGSERKGWIYTGKCDYLHYCFCQKDPNKAILYIIPFRELQKWVNPKLNEFPFWEKKTKNKTICRVVPIADVIKNVPNVECFEITSTENEYNYKRIKL